MIKNFAAPIAVLVLAVTIASFQYFNHRDDPLITDEAAWIFSSVYWTHFIKGELSHPDWKKLDAIDHPPLAKYYYGAALSLRGLNEKSIDNKNWWLVASGDEGRMKFFEEDMKRRVPLEAIHIARAAAGVSFVMLLMAIYVLGASVGGSKLGLFASVAAAANSLIFFFAPYIFADNLLVAFMCFQTAALIGWVRCRIDNRRTASRMYAILAGVLLAFASLTKFNGMLQFAPSIVAAIAAVALSREGRRTALFQSFAMIALAVCLIIVLNPANMNSLEAFPTLLKFRAGELSLVEKLSGASGMPLYDRLIFPWQAIFIDGGWSGIQLPLPLGLLLALAGVITALSVLLYGHDSKRLILLIVFTAAIVWIPPTIWSYKQSLYKRYLLPILPWIAIAIAYGMNQTVSFFRRVFEKKSLGKIIEPQLSIWIMGVVLFVVTWHLIAGSNARNSYSASIHRPVFKALHLERIVRAHPNDVDARLALVEQYLALGDDLAAMNTLEPALSARPDDRLSHALYSLLKQNTGIDAGGSHMR